MKFNIDKLMDLKNPSDLDNYKLNKHGSVEMVSTSFVYLIRCSICLERKCSIGLERKTYPGQSTIRERRI